MNVYCSGLNDARRDDYVQSTSRNGRRARLRDLADRCEESPANQPYHTLLLMIYLNKVVFKPPVSRIANLIRNAPRNLSGLPWTVRTCGLLPQI